MVRKDTAASPPSKFVRSSVPEPRYYEEAGLRKVRPYIYPFETFAKERWRGRTILDVFAGDFRDRSARYYEHAIRNATITVNGQAVAPDYLLKDNDLIRNVAHRHEPPVVAGPIQILYRDDAKGLLVVEKPGSMPIHPTGRYHHNTLLHILKFDYGLPLVHTANRLDRLTSGIIVCSLNVTTSRNLSTLFATEGGVKKEYVCRVAGRFPAEEITCREPLLTIDRQLGVNIVHKDGKHAETVFKMLSYHARTDTSVLSCRPITGRSHQIRVHLQYLGFPVANDPIYSKPVWGESGGKGGLYRDSALVEKHGSIANTLAEDRLSQSDDLGLSSSTLLSPSLRGALIRLRQARDTVTSIAQDTPDLRSLNLDDGDDTDDLTSEDASGPYCRVCGLPALSDPRPEALYIWLAAIRYSSKDWDFASPQLPAWAEADWDGDVVPPELLSA